eukprot:COSAG05_NODE_823_length_7122_cov_13.546917_1_plen_92_part_00
MIVRKEEEVATHCKKEEVREAKRARECRRAEKARARERALRRKRQIRTNSPSVSPSRTPRWLPSHHSFSAPLCTACARSSAEMKDQGTSIG